MSEESGYSLGVDCSFCHQYGTIDDGSLVCFRCGHKHKLTETEARELASLIALQRSAEHKIEP